jgi:FkbM family methyltransferase
MPITLSALPNDTHMRTSGEMPWARLKRGAIYQRLRASAVHDLYWRVARATRFEEKRRELQFYRKLLCGLRPRDLIFDIGANDGSKTDIFLRLGARVVAVEPDELNQKLIRDKFLRYRLNPRPVTVIGKAAGHTIATATMLVDGPGSALNTLSTKWAHTLRSDKARHQGGHSGLNFAESKTVSITTLEDLIGTHGMPYFVKIDVEGYEPNVLRGLRRSVPFLSFEINLPEFRGEGRACIELLHAISPGGRFNYLADSGEGLALAEWTGARDFANVLEQCANRSIEVFWKTSAGR